MHSMGDPKLPPQPDDPGERDLRWMRIALDEARAAAEHGDVPVGAALADAAGQLVATGRNRCEQAHDPMAHAEIEALRAASLARRSWRLGDATLYVTLEPCLMCAGALVHARVRRVVFGCLDEKAGAMGSLFVVGDDPRLNHRIVVRRGLLAEESATLLREFFANRRPRAATSEAEAGTASPSRPPRG